MPNRKIPGVFCLEGEWYADLRSQQSIRPLLEFLEMSGMVKDVIYRDISTVEEFKNLVLRWTSKQYGKYPIGYWGFHGSPGTIHIGRSRLSFEHLGDLLEGRCRGKSIYLGACAVFDLPKKEIRDFRKRIGAKCICGYLEDVDWFESSAFDILLLDCLSYYKNPKDTEAWLRSEHGSLVRYLGFEIYY